MFGLGMFEIVVILVVALLVFGPDRLPELARTIGKGLAEFRRASTDLRRTVMDAAEEPRRPAALAPPEKGPADEAVATASAPAPDADGERGPGPA